MRSSEPSATSSTASALSAQTAAASAPSSTLTVSPSSPQHGQLTGDPRQLTRGAGDAGVDDHGVERIVWRVRSVEGQPELAQTGPDPSIGGCGHVTQSG